MPSSALAQLNNLLLPHKLPESILKHYLKLASNDPTSAHNLLISPSTLLSPAPASKRAYAFTNAGNTCYISAILTALFASNDAFDALLTSSPTHIALRDAITQLRSGNGVPVRCIADVREQLISSGWPYRTGQQDSAELFAFLMDHLAAPTIPLHDHLRHQAPSISADNSVHSERLFWLDLPSSNADLTAMLDCYFFGETRPGLRRGASGVDARVIRSLIPSYTPTRQTGETASVALSRYNFGTLTIPLAIKRYGAQGKSTVPVHIPNIIDATPYVAPFADGISHTLILRSVVCHLGPSVSSGHYIAYTYDASVGWRRWNDLDERPVPCSRASVRTGLPERSSRVSGDWASELEQNAYILFYEMVPGDGDAQLRRVNQAEIDARYAKQQQVIEDERTAHAVLAKEIAEGDREFRTDSEDGFVRMLPHEQG